MKVIFGTLLALSGILIALYAWQPVRLQSYLLPATLKPGWVTIEYENPKCNALKEGQIWQEHVIPESGYLCTLSRRETGWVYRKYYLVESNGEQKSLSEDREIFQVGTIYLEPWKAGCNVIADSFWYGPKEQIDNRRHEILEQHHPECNKGLVTPIK